MLPHGSHVLYPWLSKSRLVAMRYLGFSPPVGILPLGLLSNWIGVTPLLLENIHAVSGPSLTIVLLSEH